jgi:hypothetical protein
MNDFKATPDCWEWQEKWASKEVPDEDSSCFLELRARVAKLEAQGRNYPETPDSSTPSRVATDEELRDIWDRAFDLRAIYILGMNHGQASSREVAEPAPVAGGLVERVSDAITSETGSRWASTEARAAILEVETWLREQGWEEAADLLEQEAGQ